ncbi:IGHMBP2 family helicase, partial [Listeria welshimeri]|nr:IGHMBP2 family helicase [Listeria welshimeri]
FQGSEKDIIIYSVVRSNNQAELGFLSDERRLNVSLSRAKQQLFIVGNSDVSSYGNSSENPFYRVINHINRNPEYCTLQD